MQRRLLVGGSLMVWGGITERDRTLLFVVAGKLSEIHYRGAIIQRYDIPVIPAQAKNVTFQQGQR